MMHDGPMTLQLKSLDETGSFSGYASIFNVVDSQNDVILPGAFKHTLRENKLDIKLLWQHRFEEPIGYFTRIEEDARGLYVEGKLLLDVQRAKEAHSLMKSGAVGGLSIGYVPVSHHIDAQTGQRILEEVALFEISLVTFPANAHATIQAMKKDAALWEHKEDISAHIHNSDFIHLADAIDRAFAILSVHAEF